MFVGFIEPKNMGPNSAQIVGRGLAECGDWNVSVAQTIPPSPWGIYSDVIYAFPRLSEASFDYARLPCAKSTFVFPTCHRGRL